MHNINRLKPTIIICLRTSIYIVDRHRCYTAAKFVAFIDEDLDKLSTLYWFPNLLIKPYIRVILCEKVYKTL